MSDDGKGYETWTFTMKGTVTESTLFELASRRNVRASELRWLTNLATPDIPDDAIFVYDANADKFAWLLP